MLDAIVKKPNRILEKQKAYQHSTKPVYYRLPRSGIYLTSYYTIFTITMASVAYGAFTMIRGKKTE